MVGSTYIFADHWRALFVQSWTLTQDRNPNSRQLHGLQNNLRDSGIMRKYQWGFIIGACVMQSCSFLGTPLPLCEKVQFVASP